MLKFINDHILGPAVPAALMLAGAYFGWLLRFFHLRHPMKILRSLSENDRSDGISAFGASMMALAGTLGVGNIVGVSSALFLGGPGAVFWMWISAFASMLLKYAEIVLAVKYRRNDGMRNHGGAMYYIKAALGGGRAASIVAGIFCVLCIFNVLGMGAMIQMNAAADVLYGVMNVPYFTTGAVGAILALFAVSSGALFLSKITNKLVPVMSALYIVMSLCVIFKNAGALSGVFGMIFSDAFSYESAAGGVVGFLFSRALRYGSMRGLLSNEAGCGTAPIAYAASNEKSPAKQGFWGIFEVFFDTIVLCTMTAIVVLISYGDPRVKESAGTVMMTVKAFSTSLGEPAAYVLAAAVFMFAFATVICFAGYGLECVGYFSNSRAAGTVFLCVYFFFIVFGAVAAPAFVWDLTDFALGSMTLINLAALCLLGKDVREETDLFFKAPK